MTKLTNEERLEMEQAGIKPDTIDRLVGDSVNPETLRRAIREIQEVVGPHGSISRVQAGGVKITREGIGVFDDGVSKTMIDQIGNLFVGSDITSPLTTTLSVFVSDQIYNNEQFGAGDMLIGDNSEGTANVFYDASEGRLNFRGGTTVQAYVDTDGKITAGSGNVVIDAGGITFANGDANQYLVFKDSSGNPTMFIYGASDDALTLNNTGTGKAIRLYVKHTDGNNHYIQIDENPSVANQSFFEIEEGSAGGRAAFGVDHFIDFLNGDGTGSATVWFNERGHNIDFIVKDEAGNQAINVDASAGTVTIAGITSGTYSPTVTAVTNVDSASADADFMYTRVGNMVQGYGSVSIDPTAGSGTTRIEISLPIASNFAAATDAVGGGSAQVTNTTGSIAADTTDDRLALQFQSPTTASMAWRIWFMYQIL
jgi:hypothetical protein